MWQATLHKITQLHKVTGLEICLLQDGSFLVQGATIRVQKGNIAKEDSFQGIGNLETLFQKVRPETPLSLVFNGKGVLVKKIATAEITGNPLQAVMPNANPEDFYFEISRHTSYTQFAIARKDMIDKLIGLFLEKGYKVLQVSLGFQPVQQVLPFFQIEEGVAIETAAFVLQQEREQGITDCRVRDKPIIDTFQLPEYQIGDQYVHACHVLAFAAAVTLATGDLRLPSPVNAPKITAARKEYGFYKYYRAGVMALLITVFGLLLINFLLYNHYFGLNRELEVTKSLGKDEQQKIAVLQQQVAQKEKLLQGAGWLKPGKISFYADRIASLTPSNTLLTSLTIYPVKTGSMNETGLVSFKQDTIQLAGMSDDPVEINQFINNLRIIPAFRQVAIINYLYKKEQGTGMFTIEIITQ